MMVLEVRKTALGSGKGGQGRLLCHQRQGSQAAPAPDARTPFVEIRLAPQLISPPKQSAPPEVWQGPATPPVDGLEPIFGRLPKGANKQWLLDRAWDWRNQRVTPELESSSVRILRESELQAMAKTAPWVAAIARQQAEEARASIRRTKSTRTIARVMQLIVDQYGWPEQD